MKIINIDEKKGILRLEVEDFEDLFFLKDIINEGDIVESYDFRTTLSGDKKVRVKIRIRVKKVELSEEGLKVGGEIINEIKNVRMGFHFFKFREGSVLTIEKEEIGDMDKKILEEYSKHKNRPSILVIILDLIEGNCIFVEVSNLGIKNIKEYTYNYPRDLECNSLEKYYSRFFQRIIDKINREYKNIKKVFVCRDTLTEHFLKSRGIKEVIKTSATSLKYLIREQRSKIFKNIREALEEKWLEEIEKNMLQEMIVVGKEEVKKFLEEYNMEKIYISLDFYFKEKEFVKEIENLIKKNNCEVSFFITKGCKEIINKYGGILGKKRYTY